MKKHPSIRITALIAIFIALTAYMLPFEKYQKGLPVEKFTKVAIAVKSTVYIEQGETYKLDIQADEKTLEKISVNYKSDELQIECKLGHRIDEPVIIRISAPSLNGISIAGSSDLFIEKTYVTDHLDLSIAGSGKMTINDLRAGKISTDVAGSGKMIINDLKSDNIAASLAGSGDILFKGGKQGSSEDFSIAGSGNIDASGFEAAFAKIEIAGSGNCTVFASEKLNVSIAGSGDVFYKGNPEIEKESAGSGRVKPLE